MDQNDPVGTGPEGGGPVIATDHERIPGAASASVVPSFLAELTRAMQAAAEQQREEIAAVVDEDAAGQVDMAHKRAAVEAGELRRLAEEDVDGIQAWATEETERIRREASQRTDERRKELEGHLAKHDSIIANEIDGVGAAVSDYRATLDGFFGQLRGATNPAEFARLAGSLPPPPDLESVRGAARANAVARFANAPQDVAEEATDEPVTEELEPAVGEAEAVVEAAPLVEEASEPPEVAAAADESTDDEAGLGVMDPDAVGRSEDLPVEPPEEGVTASAQRSSAAARMLRSIAPWAVADHDDEDHGTPNS